MSASYRSRGYTVLHDHVRRRLDNQDSRKTHIPLAHPEISNPKDFVVNGRSLWNGVEDPRSRSKSIYDKGRLKSETHRGRSASGQRSSEEEYNPYGNRRTQSNHPTSTYRPSPYQEGTSPGRNAHQGLPQTRGSRTERELRRGESQSRDASRHGRCHTQERSNDGEHAYRRASRSGRNRSIDARHYGKPGSGESRSRYTTTIDYGESRRGESTHQGGSTHHFKDGRSTYFSSLENPQNTSLPRYDAGRHYSYSEAPQYVSHEPRYSSENQGSIYRQYREPERRGSLLRRKAQPLAYGYDQSDYDYDATIRSRYVTDQVRERATSNINRRGDYWKTHRQQFQHGYTSSRPIGAGNRPERACTIDWSELPGHDTTNRQQRHRPINPARHHERSQTPPRNAQQHKRPSQPSPPSPSPRIPKPKAKQIPKTNHKSSSQTPNHYETLGIDRASSHKEVQRAAKIMRVATHPDKLIRQGMTDEEKAAVNNRAAEVGHAADVLLDEKLRREYDDEFRRRETMKSFGDSVGGWGWGWKGKRSK